MRASIDHVGIHVSDLERSLRFYGETLGLKLYRRMKIGDVEIAFLDLRGTYLELVHRRGAPEGPPKGRWSHVALVVDDFDGVVSRIEEMGLGLRRITLPDGTRIVFFKDPDGHDVEVLERGVAQ
jgi:catechol 2,3-dioxygenase-like lactoylglutathione lyase family enzyme